MSNINNAPITDGIDMEHAAIFIRRFRDPEGKPTCCANAETGDACKFLGVRNFGAVSSCMLGAQLDLSRQQNGFLRPHDKCDLWADAVFNGRGASAESERMANQIRARLAEQAARLYADMDAAVAAERERCAAFVQAQADDCRPGSETPNVEVTGKPPCGAAGAR